MLGTERVSERASERIAQTKVRLDDQGERAAEIANGTMAALRRHCVSCPQGMNLRDTAICPQLCRRRCSSLPARLCPWPHWTPVSSSSWATERQHSLISSRRRDALDMRLGAARHRVPGDLIRHTTFDTHPRPTHRFKPRQDLGKTGPGRLPHSPEKAPSQPRAALPPDRRAHPQTSHLANKPFVDLRGTPVVP
jgi:hypothetical protein